MSKPLRLFSIILFISLLLSACGGAPSVLATPAELDLGAIPAADPVTGTLVIRNQGNAPLRIESLSTSCGCTTAEVANETIAPNSETTLRVTFDPLAHAGLYGPLLRLVYVATNDPNLPELGIPVTVTVLDPEEASK